MEGAAQQPLATLPGQDTFSRPSTSKGSGRERRNKPRVTANVPVGPELWGKIKGRMGTKDCVVSILRVDAKAAVALQVP